MSAAAVLSLALGMTINAAAFSVIDALLFRPLPIRDPAGLVRVTSGQRSDLSFPDFEDAASASRTLQGLAASQLAGAIEDDGSRSPEVVSLGLVTANYFSTLGVSATRGRTVGEIDRAAGAAPAVAISYDYWQSHFAGDPNIVGRPIKLNTKPWTIVGVLPEGFAGTQPLLAPAVWMTTDAAARNGRSLGTRTERSYSTFARLAPGATIEQARAEVVALGQRIAHDHPDTDLATTLTADFEKDVRVQGFSVAIALAIVLVSLPLIIGCANVAGLLLGHGESRRKEVAIRLSLGASRGQLVRQLLSETAALSALAVGVSLLVAAWLLRLAPALLPPLPVSFNLDFRIDARIAAIRIAIGVAATLLSGLVPALIATRSDLATLIKGAGSLSGKRGDRMRSVLVTGQVAVSFLLVLLSALFGISLLNAQNQHAVLPTSSLAFAALSPGAFGYDAPRAQAFYDDLLDRARHRAGIDAAAFVRHVPLNSLYGGGATQNVAIPGIEPPKGQTPLAIRQNVVSPGYFATMDIPLVRGRDFGSQDVTNGARVLIINETMANLYWPGGDAINRAVDLVNSTTGARSPATVIGVAHDTKYATLKETTPPYLYLPLSQQRAGEMTLITRGSLDENTLAAVTRDLVRELNPAMPPVELMTKSQHLRRALFGERLLAGVVTAIGAISLLLAVVGLYGVVAFAVARRTRDIGIEMALGATTQRVINATMAIGARLTVIGMLIGGAIGILVAQLFGGALYGVSALSPRVLGGSIVITAIVTLAATFVPARRASKIDPIVALRE